MPLTRRTFLQSAGGSLLYGAAAAYGPLQRDPGYHTHFAEECGILAPENALSKPAWSAIAKAFDGAGKRA